MSEPNAGAAADAAETAQQRKTPSKRRMPHGRVTVFPNWCKGCDLCIQFCPAGVLEHQPGVNVAIVHPEKCTACRWCELHCPDFAIFVTDVENDQVGPETES